MSGRLSMRECVTEILSESLCVRVRVRQREREWCVCACERES